MNDDTIKEKPEVVKPEIVDPIPVNREKCIENAKKRINEIKTRPKTEIWEFNTSSFKLPDMSIGMIIAGMGVGMTLGGLVLLIMEQQKKHPGDSEEL